MRELMGKWMKVKMKGVIIFWHIDYSLVWMLERTTFRDGGSRWEANWGEKTRIIYMLWEANRRCLKRKSNSKLRMLSTAPNQTNYFFSSCERKEVQKNKNIFYSIVGPTFPHTLRRANSYLLWLPSSSPVICCGAVASISNVLLPSAPGLQLRHLLFLVQYSAALHHPCRSPHQRWHSRPLRTLKA